MIEREREKRRHDEEREKQRHDKKIEMGRKRMTIEGKGRSEREMLKNRVSRVIKQTQKM